MRRTDEYWEMGRRQLYNSFFALTQTDRYRMLSKGFKTCVDEEKGIFDPSAIGFKQEHLWGEDTVRFHFDKKGVKEMNIFSE